VILIVTAMASAAYFTAGNHLRGRAGFEVQLSRYFGEGKMNELSIAGGMIPRSGEKL